MNVLADTWRQLVSRRLWPVALLLVAAVAAIPFFLAKEPETPVSAPLPQSKNTDSTLSGDPVVALATQEEARRRRVLGASKDPFEPAPLPKTKSTPAPSVPEPVELTPDAPSTGGTPVDSTPIPIPTTPIGTTPAEPKKTYPLYSIKVRFGDATADTLESGHIDRLDPLPSADAPVLIYLGTTADGKSAVFMVDNGVVAQGDGSCKPSPATCETIHMSEGDTEFFDVIDPETGEVGAQYQLDLLDIKTKKTTSAAKARAEYARADKAGKRIVRARQSSRPLRYSYDARRGVVKRVGKKAYKAAVARSALAMAGGF